MSYCIIQFLVRINNIEGGSPQNHINLHFLLNMKCIKLHFFLNMNCVVILCVIMFTVDFTMSEESKSWQIVVDYAVKVT